MYMVYVYIYILASNSNFYIYFNIVVFLTVVLRLPWITPKANSYAHRYDPNTGYKI